MNRKVGTEVDEMERVPRTRGDEPVSAWFVCTTVPRSPHTRG